MASLFACIGECKLVTGPTVPAVSAAAVGASLLPAWMVAASKPETVAVGAVLAATPMAGSRARKQGRD